MKRIVLLVVLALVGAACSSGPAAPEPTPTPVVCTDAFCLHVPDGWEGEIGESHLAFHHELDPDNTFLTASMVDMEAVVEAAGRTWPIATDEVVRSFWVLLEQQDVGEFSRSERMVGGAIRSWGSHETGDMWFVLVPIGSINAIGVEIRGPNDSWESHADAVFPSVQPVGSQG